MLETTSKVRPIDGPYLAALDIRWATASATRHLATIGGPAAHALHAASRDVIDVALRGRGDRSTESPRIGEETSTWHR